MNDIENIRWNKLKRFMGEKHRSMKTDVTNHEGNSYYA